MTRLSRRPSSSFLIESSTSGSETGNFDEGNGCGIFGPEPVTSALDQPRFRVGDLVVDRGTYQVRFEDQEVPLPRLSFDLLVTLAERAPDVVKTADLMDAVWGDVVVSEETVVQRVKLLRDALRAHLGSTKYIETVRGRGYRLAATVQSITPELEPSPPLVDPAKEKTAINPAKDRPARAFLRFAVAGLLLAGVVWAVGMRFSARDAKHGSTSRHSIAVLPLKDMSPGGDQAYFTDGIHEELLSRLAELEHFDVPSRTSVEAYRERKVPAKQIAEELGVDTLLEGSVRHASGRVRVTVQLIDGQTDRHLWVQDYDRMLSMDNLFAIQRDLAQAIARELGAQLSPDDQAQIERKPTQSLAAYDAYLKGKYHADQYTSDDLRRAKAYYERATELDPNFAEAWSGLAFVYTFGATAYGWMRPAEAVGPAKRYAQRALTLDPERPQTLSLMANIALWFDWDAAAATAYFERALTADPRYVGARASYAYLLSSLGRHDDAIAQVETCVALEPRSTVAHSNAAWRYLNARRYDRAIHHAEMALSLDDRFHDARNALGLALVLADREAEALRVVEQDGFWWPARAYTLAVVGRIDEARELLRGLATETFVRPLSLAYIHVALGEHDEAFRWLELAVRERRRGILMLDVMPVFDPLRKDARFDALRRALHAD